MSKQSELKKLEREIEHCEICKNAGWGKQVFGEGDPNAKIMFVGEAPGRREAATGRPFIGPSGHLLRKMIREIGLEEQGVYITSPVKFFPLRGTPSKKEIVHAREHFNKQVSVINPDVMVLLGKTAATAVLDRDIPIMKEHGKIHVENGRKILVTIHPAAVLRFRKNEEIMKSDFKNLEEYLSEE